LLALARTPGPEIPGVEWIAHDLVEALASAALPDRIDAVVHLAQSRAFRDFPAGAADVYAVNVDATARLLEHARVAGAATFVLASSGSVYGAGSLVTEAAPLAPRSFYAATRAAADLLVQGYADVLSTVVLRPFTIYGEGQRGMLVPNLLERLRVRAPIEIEGDPGLRLNPIHVDDAARAFERAVRLGRSAVVNVAGVELVSLRQLVELLAAAVDVQPSIRHVGTGDGGELTGDVTAMSELLDVAPSVSLAEGLSRVARA
jgi:nucleoside-diphosphate-sugar epimerase